MLQHKAAFRKKQQVRFAASTLWNSLPDHFRTENSFCSPGMGSNVAVLHVDNIYHLHAE
jgi:hypothetical protein